MPSTKSPRKGSMQVWPRKRAKNSVARIRYWPSGKENKPVGFAGYKVGMTTAFIIDNKSTSITKGQEIPIPVTIIECPPLKVASVRFYKKNVYGLTLSSEVFADKLDKELKRKTILPKKPKKKFEDIKEFEDIRLIVYTQPKLTGIGKKKPDLFELGLGGSKDDKLTYAKEILGKEIKVEDVFAPGQMIDIHGITKGKGFQGPVKRMGVKILRHKSEKKKRGPGTLGAWTCQMHTMYRMPFPGQMGYHQRTDYNKWLIKIDSDAALVTPKGGFMHYGNVKNTYLILKGSVIGPRKRLVKMLNAIRPNESIPAPEVQEISTTSKQ